jgi:hypothetical protein
MFTGDDYHYVGLIEGDERGHSDALLGAFAALAPNASAAIQALDRGDAAAYRDILGPTEVLSQQVFAAPTYYYKTGVAFLSWLNGHQAAFQMVGAACTPPAACPTSRASPTSRTHRVHSSARSSRPHAGTRCSRSTASMRRARLHPPRSTTSCRMSRSAAHPTN